MTVPDHTRLRSFGGLYSQQESNCRIEELTRALGRSTRITPVRFAWISPASLCAEMQGGSGRSTAPLLIGALPLLIRSIETSPVSTACPWLPLQRVTRLAERLQGYLTHKKHPTPRTLQ